MSRATVNRIFPKGLLAPRCSFVRLVLGKTSEHITVK